MKSDEKIPKTLTDKRGQFYELHEIENSDEYFELLLTFEHYRVGYVPNTNFRGLGLGKQLLEIVIAHAQFIGVKFIDGMVTGPDKQNTPYLVMFYQDRGFEFTGGGIYLCFDDSP